MTSPPKPIAHLPTQLVDFDASEAAELELLAGLVADLVVDRLCGLPVRRLMTVAEVADYLAVDASFVYANASAMGARRLGEGPKAPLRFRLEDVDEWASSCTTGRKSHVDESPAKPPNRRRRCKTDSGTNVVLLPIRGRVAAEIRLSSKERAA